MEMFKASRREIILTIVCGLGEVGDQIIKYLNDLNSFLPPEFEYSKKFISITDLNQIEEFIYKERNDLARIDNLDKIREFGKEPSQGDLVKVRHIIIGNATEILKICLNIKNLQKKNQLDYFEAVCISEDVEASSFKNQLDKVGSTWRKFSTLTTYNSSGASLNLNLIYSSIVGATLLSLLVDLPINESEKYATTFGFAGCYGLVGNSFRRLAVEESVALLQRQSEPLSEDERNNKLPPKFDEFIKKYDPKSLALEFFNRCFRIDKPTKETMSATAKWVGDNNEVFQVILDKGLIGLEITPRGKEENWVEQLRRYSRVLDMTVAYNWKLKLENTAIRFADEISKNVLAAFTNLIDRCFRGVCFSEHTLEVLKNKLNEPRRPMEENQNDLNEVLNTLDQTIKSRPNPLMLVFRVGLWVIPALVAGSIIIQSLYDSIRGMLFTVGFLCVGTLLPAGWILWQLDKARRKIIKARDDVINIITERQAAILSENTLAYLNDTILGPLNNIIAKEFVELLANRKGMFGTALKITNEQRQKSLDPPITFGPILVSPAHYAKAFEKINIDVDKKILEVIINERFVSVDNDPNKLIENIVSWCNTDLKNQNLNKILTFAELFEIKFAGQNEEIVQYINKSWEFATPLMHFRYAPDKVREESLIVTPPVILKLINRIKMENSKYNRAEILEESIVPFFCVYRYGITKIEIDGNSKKNN